MFIWALYLAYYVFLMPIWSACRLDIAQLGGTLSIMDSMTYSRAVAEVINKTIDASPMHVPEIAKKSGIARTTLMRRLEHPELSPFNILELAQLAALFHLNLSDIIRDAEKAI